jgi:predicted acylesterase/phospholipase RssA
VATKPQHRRLAVILSGGGARGAYEVGVLWYLFDELTRMRGAPPRVDVICGTSVGAINSAYLAAHLADPVLGMRRWVDVWSSLRLDDVLGFGWRQAVSLPRVLIGGGSGTRASSRVADGAPGPARILARGDSHHQERCSRRSASRPPRCPPGAP